MKLVFKWEGGYSEAAGDPGGPTNYGITIATLGLYRKLRVTPADVKALTRLEATSIYERYFWDAISADQLQNGVDVIAFDIAVNMGPRRASRWILETDALEPIPRINELHKRRLSFWQHLASFARFGRGWTNRENDVQACALNVAKYPLPAGPTFTSQSKPPDPVEQFRVELQKLFPIQTQPTEDQNMLAPKISLSYVVSIFSSLVGLAHVTGLISLAPGVGILPGIGLLFAAGALAALKRSKLRDLEEQQLARLTNQKIADLLLEGQDQLASVIQSQLGVQDGTTTMNTAEGLIGNLTAAYQQFPASHVEAALSAAKAVSAVVQQINAAANNLSAVTSAVGLVSQPTTDNINDATPLAPTV